MSHPSAFSYPINCPSMMWFTPIPFTSWDSFDHYFYSPHHLMPSPPQLMEDIDRESVNEIINAFTVLQFEHPHVRFTPDEECTIKGMEAKAIREEHSEIFYGDRHEIDRQLRSSMPPSSLSSSSSSSSSPSIDPVAKWIVTNDIEKKDEEESVFDAAIFEFPIFKGWIA